MNTATPTAKSVVAAAAPTTITSSTAAKVPDTRRAASANQCQAQTPTPIAHQTSDCSTDTVQVCAPTITGANTASASARRVASAAMPATLATRRP